MAELEFILSSGILKWNEQSYSARSGGFGKGPLPTGKYTVDVKHAVESKNLGSGFLDPLSKKRWFIPIEPDFTTDRKKLGIHPDGPPAGTEGCIGLKGASANLFFTKWNRTSISSRPTKLTVI